MDVYGDFAYITFIKRYAKKLVVNNISYDLVVVNYGSRL